MWNDVFAEKAKGVEHLMGAAPARRVGIAGPAEADIHPPVAQNVERRHALHDVQRVMDRGQHHAHCRGAIVLVRWQTAAK
jgi:hypothetical protein